MEVDEEPFKGLTAAGMPCGARKNAFFGADAVVVDVVDDVDADPGIDDGMIFLDVVNVRGDGSSGE